LRQGKTLSIRREEDPNADGKLMSSDQFT